MKKISILLIALSININLYAQLTVDSTGNVAIQKLNAEYALDVYGNFRVDNWTDVILEYNSHTTANLHFIRKIAGICALEHLN